MSVVRFDHQVGHRQLQLVGPEAASLVLRGQAVARAQEQQDVRRLGDDLLARHEERRGEGNMRQPAAVQQAQHCLHAQIFARLPGDVDVGCGSLFERQSDEFAASLDSRPVVQVVGHESLLLRAALAVNPGREPVRPSPRSIMRAMAREQYR